jgi:hypothetical protein
MSIGKQALLVVSTIALLSIIIVQPAAAQCGPNSTANCSASSGGYEGILGNIFDVSKLTLKYVGFIAIVLGAALWATTRKSSSRAQYGSWMFAGGAGMLIFYFGFNVFVGLLRFIAGGG